MRLWEASGIAFSLVVRDRCGKNLCIDRTRPILSYECEFRGNSEPSLATFEKSGVGNEHGCKGVSHFEPPTSTEQLNPSRTKACLVREARFLLRGASIIGLLFLPRDFAYGRVALVQPECLGLRRARERVETKRCHDHSEA